ncbi:MAG: hypothetical protein R3C19_02180 [Planctomycetaceae bacterium]
MSTFQWLKRLRRRLAADSGNPARRERHLRLIQLEDRRVLNAAVALVGTEIQITGLEAAGLIVTIENHDFDGGGGNPAVASLAFELDSGNWNVDGSLGANDADLGPPGNRVLFVRVDAALFDSVLIQGSNADDNSLIVDFSGGNPLETVTSFTFLGGESVGDDDRVQLAGYNVDTLTLTHTGAEDGTLTFDTGGTLSTFAFGEIEPLSLSGTAADLIINLPAGADDNVVLSDDGGANDDMSLIDSPTNGAFESTQFMNPTNSLTINDGTGAKTIHVQGLDGNWDADLTIVDEDATNDNVVTFDTNSTDLGTGSLDVESDTISISEAVTTAGGDIVLDALSTVTSSAAGDITTTGAAAGDASGLVDINAGGDVTLDGFIDTSGAGANSDGGQVTIDSLDGDIAVNDVINATAGAGGTGADILLTAADAAIDGTATGSITVGGILSVNEDAAVTLLADNAIALNANITAAGTGSVTVTSNADAATDGGTEDIVMAAATLINAGAGAIALSTTGAGGGDITADQLTTTNSSATAVQISSQQAVQINDAITTAGGDVTITAATTVISAAAGDITTTGAAAGNNSGDVTISAGTNVTLAGSLDTSGAGAGSGGGLVTIATVDGDITVNDQLDTSAGAGGTGGNIQLTASDANNANAVATGSITQTGILLTNGNASITLNADNAIAVNADITAAGTGAVSLTANADAASDGGTESILMAAGTTLDAGSGTAALSTAGTGGGGIVLSRVETTNSGTAAVTINSQVTITGAAGENVVAPSGRLVADAVSGIDIRTDVGSLNASVSGAGNIVIAETNDINLFDVDTADGAITVTAAGLITARDVDSSATDSDLNDISLTSTAGSIDVVTIRAAATAAAQNDVTLLAADSINDADPGADNVDVTGQDVTLTATAGDIGESTFNPATDDVFKFAFDALEVEAFDNLTATAAGSLAVNPLVNPSVSLTLTADTVFVESAGDIDSTAIALTATNLALIAGGTVTVADAGLVIDGDLRISAANVRAVTLGGTVILGSNVTRVDRLLYDVTTADDELVGVFADQLDVSVSSDIQIAVVAATQITDLDCSFTGFDTNGNTAVLISITGPVTQGTNADTPPGPPAGFNDRILSNELLLLGTGPFTLQHADNDVNTLAADSVSQVLYRDANSLTVGTISEILAATSHNGIVTANADVKLTVGDAPGDNLTIDQAISAGTGNVLLDVAGNVTQSAAGIITSTGLALMVDGTATLNSGNDVDIFAADDGGVTQFTDIDGFAAGSVTVDGMTVTGITTSNDDVKLTTTSGSLDIDDDISLGSGDLFLMVAGNVTQQAGDTIAAAGLGLDVVGTVALDEANDVDTLAAGTGGPMLFTDSDGFTIGQVTVAGMTVTGITTSDDNVRLTATTGNVVIDEAVDVGAGSIRFDVAGNLSQQAGDTVTAAGLALRVGGTTSLDEANAVGVLAADNGGQTLFTDADGFAVGAVLVDGVNVVGVVTSNDPTRLTATAGNIDINEIVNVGTTDLVLVAGGNVAQQAGDIITASGLGLVVGGTTTLNEANVLGVLAVDNGGLTQVTDADSLTIGQVSVAGTTVTGLTTSDDSVKLTLGPAVTDSLLIGEAVALGGGSLFVMAGGTAVQTVGGTVSAAGLGLDVAGAVTLNSANNVATFAADSDNEVQFTNAGNLSVGTVTVAAMSVTGITTTGDDVKLTTTSGDLNIDDDIATGAGSVLLVVAGNVTQQAGDTIAAAGLGLMVNGTTNLTQANDVDTFAASNNGQTLFTDADDLTVGSVTVDGMTVTGIVTSSDDVRLTVGSAAGHNLTIMRVINVFSANVLLDVGGNVTQAASGTVTATGLGLMVDGTTLLDLPNNVDTLAANNNGTIGYRDSNDLAVGEVAVDGTTITGITTSDDDVLLEANGALSVDESISTGGPAGTAAVRLVADGSITQSAAGVIVTDSLGVRQQGGSGDIGLTSANDVDIFAAVNQAAGGALSFTDANSVLIDEVAAQNMGTIAFAVTTSVTTNNGDLTLTTGADLLTAATRDITSSGGNILLQAGNDLVTGSGSDIDSGSGTITVTTVRDATLDGNVTTNGSTIDLQTGRNLTTLAGRDITSSGGDITVSAGQDIVTGAASDIDAAGGSIAGTAVRDILLGGNVTTTGATIDLVAGNDLITAGGADITSDGGDILLDAGQDITMGAGSDIGAAGGSITGAAVRDILLGGNVTTGLASIDLQAGRDVTTAAGSDIISGGGSITVDAGQDITTGAGSDIDAAAGAIAATAGRDMLLDGSVSAVNASIDLQAGRDLTTEATRTVTAEGGDISVTATRILRILGDVTSEITGTTTDEIITLTGTRVLIGFDDRVNMQHVVTISTDDVLAGSLTGVNAANEGVRIVADNPAITTLDGSGNNIADGSVTLGDDVTIRTDGGVAMMFAPRPQGFVPGTAFFVQIPNPIPPVFDNEPISELSVLNSFRVIIGVAGEENLLLSVDFMDPEDGDVSAADIATAQGLSTFLNTLTSDALQENILVDQGGMIREVGHLYSTIFDAVGFLNTGVVQIPIQFSVSFDPSISVQGQQITQNSVTNNVAEGILSETSDNNLATTQGFENGRAVFSLPTGILLPIEPEPEPPKPAPAPAAAPPVAPEQPLFVMAVQAAEFANGGYSTQSEDFYQLRQEDRDEPVIERIAEEFGENLMQPKRLREFVRQEPRIDNGTGYELWLITTKVNENGQTVTIERPVLKFDVFNREPTPATEELPDVFPEIKLIPMPTDDTDEAPAPEENAADDSGDDVSLDSRPDDGVLPGAGPADVKQADVPADAPQRAALDLPATEHVDVPTSGESRVAQSAVAGLLVSGVLSGRTGTTGPKKRGSLVDRLKRRCGL